MDNLKNLIQEAENNRKAVGHFNISDCVDLKAIFKAAQEMSKYQNTEIPIIIGVSEGEREFIGAKRAALMVKSLREEYDYPIFINADHTKSLDKIKEAVEAGFDAVMFDGGGLPLEENIKKTREIVEYVKSVSPNTLVEGELGYIKGSSSILTTSQVVNIEEEDLTKPEQAKRFVKETGVDLLAPSVGNIHGMFKGAPNPPINIGRIRELREASGVPLILHGGSGIRDEEFSAAIDAGISVIHINTELRFAWRRGLEKALKEKPEEIIPYKLLPTAVEEIEEVVYNRLKLFNGIKHSEKGNIGQES